MPSVDQPIAGLILDLKQRGLLDDVVVVCGTEFGRTPGLELRGGGKTGRDHHPNGFTIWMAGVGLKQGYVHGATDELGYHTLDEGHYVTDLPRCCTCWDSTTAGWKSPDASDWRSTTGT